MSVNISTEEAVAVAMKMVDGDRTKESLARLLLRCLQALEGEGIGPVIESPDDGDVMALAERLAPDWGTINIERGERYG